MEALELIRRWIWVFFRVEWESVKMMQEKDTQHLSLMRSVGPGHGNGNGVGNGAADESIELFNFPEESETSQHPSSAS